MPTIARFILLLLAAICFGVATLAAPLGVSSRINLAAAGLLLWVLVPLVTAAENLH
jgi:hypothetical protein